MPLEDDCNPIDAASRISTDWLSPNIANTSSAIIGTISWYKIILYSYVSMRHIIGFGESSPFLLIWDNIQSIFLDFARVFKSEKHVSNELERRLKTRKGTRYELYHK
jgi:hypothetical protein